ncbi:hypothetical protein [Planococcus ruber]|uniref:hypothetical protein n=1 Tax=Planococcus ruber TaxID=2027871 RepID=UPI001FEEA578|nr:hypothetical protein [Planococcus ruber]MCJ1907516.1 hypothetical protein [Planococcus ruber]
MILEIMLVLLMISTGLFIHELGHAVATVMQNKKATAEIYLGSSSKEKKLKIKLGRITCYLTLALYGFCIQPNWREVPLSAVRPRTIFLLGGPLLSLVGAALFYAAAIFSSGVPESIFVNLAGICFFLFASPLLPFTYPRFLGGGRSDGLQLLNLIKENRKQRNAVL